MKIKQIIIRAYLLVLCLVLSFFRGRANKGSKPNRFLIIQTAKLGDMVCTTPMFRAIKKRYPDARVIVAGNATNKELLAGNNDVDSYYVFNKQSLFQLIPILKKEKIDFACITSPSFENLVLAYLAGASKIVAPVVRGGFSPYETRSFKLLRHLAILIPHRMGHYAPGEYLKMLEPAGIYDDDTKKNLAYSSSADREVSDFFTASGITDSDFVVGIAPSAGNKIKQWPVKSFSEITDYIYQNYKAKIIIIGYGKDSVEVNEMLVMLNRKTKAINTLNLFNLDELKALISKMNLFIAVDTGPIYIAEAFQVPLVDITGPIDEREQPPVGPFYRIVKPQTRKQPELYVMNARRYDYKEARRQVESISVGMVIDEVDNLIETIKNGS